MRRNYLQELPPEWKEATRFPRYGKILMTDAQSIKEELDLLHGIANRARDAQMLLPHPFLKQALDEYDEWKYKQAQKDDSSH
jgi:hypothetical protein